MPLLSFIGGCMDRSTLILIFIVVVAVGAFLGSILADYVWLWMTLEDMPTDSSMWR